MSGLFFKYRCEGSRLPSPGGQRMASERVTCRVPGEEADGPLGGVWASVVIITLDHHSDRVFRGNTSSPTDHFARALHFLLVVERCSPRQAEAPPRVGVLRWKMLLLLSVVLAESTAQVFCLFVFFFFYFLKQFVCFAKPYVQLGK